MFLYPSLFYTSFSNLKQIPDFISFLIILCFLFSNLSERANCKGDYSWKSGVSRDACLLLGAKLLFPERPGGMQEIRENLGVFGFAGMTAPFEACSFITVCVKVV